MAKNSDKKYEVGGVLFLGSLLIGTGLGIGFDKTAMGTLIGLGVGFILLAFTISKFK